MPPNVCARIAILVSVAMCAAHASQAVDPKYGHLPVHFEPNLGQAPDQIRYYSHDEGFQVLMTDAETIFQRNDRPHATVRMKMPGHARGSLWEAIDKLPGISNYYIGNDPTKWRTKVPQYSRLKRRDVYPGIDLVFYANEGQLEYDCIVKPGADPSQIRLAFEGVERLQVDSNGDLLLRAGGHELLRQKKPAVYQENQTGQRQEISGGYQLVESKTEVRFVLGNYDHSRTLVVDPALVYAAYPHSFDTSLGIAVDNTGNAYITGFTGPPPVAAISSDAFIAKLNPTGTALVYFTRIGGSSSDYGSAIAVDQNGNAYVAGATQSSDFPVKSAAQSVKPGGQDGFVTKLDTNGAIVFSTYLGGSDSDSLTTIAVDGSANVYVGGTSSSTDFPVINALQPNLQGTNSAVIAKLNSSGSSLLFSTYLGGGTNLSITGAQGIALGLDKSIWVVGYCGPLFPTVNPIQQSFGGSVTDAFIAQLDNSGATLLFSTFLGGSGEDSATGVTVDKFGNILVTGSTISGNFPLVSPLQANLDNAENAFVAKLSPNPPTLLYSTYFSGAGATSIGVDNAGNATIVGRFIEPDPGGFSHFQTVYSLPSLLIDNGYAAQIDSAGATLLYSTFVNDNSRPAVPLGYASAVAVDNAGNAYLTGSGFYVLKLSQETVRCNVSVTSVSPITFPASGGAGVVNFLNPSGCGFPVYSTADPTPWLRACLNCLVGAGQTSGQLTFTVDPNDTIARTASLFINGTGFTVSQAAGVAPPPSLNLIGFWDTPVTSTNASGVVAISGWALSSNSISVQIYRNTVPGEVSPNGLVFIGNGTFVAGSRPDVALQHPEYSSKNNAGWSYALLTNTLPNADGSAGKGNGTYQITVILQDSGNQITLPTRTIIVSNKNVPKPFGTIDTPAPGTVVSGNSYINFGWALTPQPFQISFSGSTINVFLDGKPSGALTSYNNFRSDVAAVLSGYQNSNGAVGYATIDTTALKIGQHTISWGVTDNNNQTASVGNRIFTVLDGTATAAPLENRAGLMLRRTDPIRISHPSFSGEVMLRKGYDISASLQQLSPNKSFTYEIVIRQLDRLELHLLDINSNPVACASSVLLPVGSTLDEEMCTFYWQIDPSFLGTYPLMFSSELGDVRGRVIVLRQ
jgi:hypothetical protein